MRFFKPGRLLIYLFVGVYLRNSFFGKINIEKTITIKKGQAASVVLQDLGWIDKQRLKWSFRNHSEELAAIQPGSYSFTGSYTPTQIIAILTTEPTSSYQRFTVLEGRNMRDVDKKLVDEGLITAGDYIKFVSDDTIIAKYSEKYEFLRQATNERRTLVSLEGYLYPETYMLDPSKDIIDQLVLLQLEAFNDRIWKPYGDKILTLSDTLVSKGYSFKLSSYATIILASIIEKEERVDSNKTLIASIFFNRLETDMRIDADISLCYGLQEPYESCTPSRIGQHIGDKNNLYNTRAVKGLPPTPISNIQASSIQALLTAEKTDYFFYLHNNTGKIFPAKDIAEHNSNISKELR